MNLSKKFRHMLYGPDVCIFHEFHKPPYGGGNQFLLALIKELEHQGCDVGINKVGKNTKACLFNSFNFNFEKLSKLSRKYDMRMIHRLAGPIGIYRGTDIEIDRQTQQLNARLADATIFISDYSAQKYAELGLEYKNPTVIKNTVDPEIFHAKGRIAKPDPNRKIRLIATAWSNNPKKGGPLLSWLDQNLDHSRYELTFVGRTQASFTHARVMDPVPSERLSGILREHDIYIAPSEDDPCSNALLEALACGHPVVYRKSGGHPELVGEAGAGFTNNEEALKAIDQVAEDIEKYRSLIKLQTMSDVARRYLSVLIPTS
jgi:glycosyltransferase involved in cell wall biosynthesis